MQTPNKQEYHTVTTVSFEYPPGAMDPNDPEYPQDLPQYSFFFPEGALGMGPQNYQPPQYNGYYVVTPSYAKWALEYHGSDLQRRTSGPSVKKYSLAMEAGEWAKAAWSPIAWDEYDRLANAYHRFNAVVKSDVTVIMYFVVGVPSQDFPIMDTNLPRRAEQWVSNPNAKIKTISANQLFWIQHDKAFGTPVPGHIPSEMDKAEKWAGLTTYAPDVTRVWKELKSVNRSSLLTVLAMAALTQYADKIDSFLDGFTEGVQDPEDPRSVLHEQYAKINGDASMSRALKHRKLELNKPSSSEAVSLFIMAWNAFVSHDHSVTTEFKRSDKLGVPHVKGFHEFD